MFTRRHHQKIAAEFRASRVEIDETHDVNSDAYFWKVLQWEDMVADFAAMFGNDNSAFDLDRWYMATGYQRMPDGSYYADRTNVNRWPPLSDEPKE